MDHSVMEDESMMGAQAPVVSSRKTVTCATCGKGFAKQANLKRHVEVGHTDQTTPEAVAKRLKLAEYLKTYRHERRKNGSATNRAKKKALDAIAAGGACALPASEAKADEKMDEAPKDKAVPTEEAKADADASSASINEPSADAPEPDNRRERGGRVKPPRARALPTAPSVFRVTTTALTTANVAGFFEPKYSAPRSKEQRLAAPRSSAI